MGYDFVALPIETGGHQSEEAEQFFDRLVKYAGSGDSSDEARFRHFAATSLMMTNQIGVARTILANLPITRHSQDRVGRPLLGYAPLAPSFLGGFALDRRVPTYIGFARAFSSPWEVNLLHEARCMCLYLSIFPIAS